MEEQILLKHQKKNDTASNECFLINDNSRNPTSKDAFLIYVFIVDHFLVRGSKNKIAISTSQFAPSTASVIVIKIPCMRG